MLAGTLITKAYYLSGIVPRNFESVDRDELADGLDLLNDVLSEINVTGSYIPYFSYPQITCVVGQEEYLIPNAVDIMTATFNIGSVRYEMYQDTLKHYFGSPRVDNLKALPLTWFWERVDGGVKVSVFMLPQQNFVMKFKCKIALSNVTVNTELDDTYDRFYQLFLKYKLADYICDFYNVSTPPKLAARLDQYENIYTDLNAYDYTVNKVASYSKTDSMSYAQANIGKGWTAP